MFRFLFTVLILSSGLFASIKTKIIHSSHNNLIIQVLTEPVTTADLFPSSFIIGLPGLKIPKTQIRYYGKSPNPFPSFNKEKQTEFDWHGLQKLQNLYCAVLEIDPKTKDGNFFEIEFKRILGVPIPLQARMTISAC